MLDEEKMLRDRFKQLQNEKKIRLEQFNGLSSKECELCEQLKLKETDIKSSVPTESELELLKNRIKELELLKVGI